MRNHLDHLAKHLGREALGRSGATVIHDEIAPETQYADLRHEPDPRRTAARGRLGLLGQLAATVCLIEVFGHAPGAEELRACLAKHLAFWRHRARTARAANAARKRRGAPPLALAPPVLWILSAGVPATLLAELACRRAPSPDWPSGVYFVGGTVLRVGLIVGSRLPRVPATLLVRLMAAGPLLPKATADLRALPATAPARAIAEPILLSYERRLRRKAHPTPTEQEFLVEMYKTFDDIRAASHAKGLSKGRAEGLTKGLAKGRTETQAQAVLTVLRVRGIPVPATTRKRILGQKNLQRLERWLEKAVVATSLKDVLGARG